MTNTTQPEIEAVAVTAADRSAYLRWSMLSPDDQAAVMAGEWDNTTGMQILAEHRLAAMKPQAPEVDDGVAREDRDAAGDYLFPATHGDIPAVEEWHRIVTGADDGHRLVQAFRRHRLASVNPARVDLTADNWQLLIKALLVAAYHSDTSAPKYAALRERIERALAGKDAS